MNSTVRTLLPTLALLASLPMLTVPGVHASDHTLYDQSNLSLTSGSPITSNVFANDFLLPIVSRIDTVTVWLVSPSVAPLPEGNDVPGFFGSIGWAVYNTFDGAPGDLLYSGVDFAPELTDTGLLSDGFPVYRARIHLDGRPGLVGRNWIALREGPWGLPPADPSPLFWLAAASEVGESSYVSNDTEIPTWAPSVGDHALVVEGDPGHWYQQHFAKSLGENISTQVVAVDFALQNETRLGSLDIWLADNAAGNDGVLGSFDGTLSWAIYANGSGAPTGSPLFSGHDSSPTLADTGIQDDFSADLVRARIELEGRPLLPAGTYWLALHEGTWLQPYDGDPIWLQPSSGGVVNATPVKSDAETAPASWVALTGKEFAFVLFEDELFASGFEAGVACAWSGVSGATLCP